MEIYSKGEYPSCALSNFAKYEFTVDGVPCNSMEGFLQSLKYRSPKKQREICLLWGKRAKKAGKYKFLWKIFHLLWWQGKRMNREGEAYREVLDRAYSALFQNTEFRKALLDSGEQPLTHAMGKSNPKKTVLTEEEFISRLLRLRQFGGIN